jgi:ABC-type nickel/cobalt efflux system permease component RcnA
VSGGLREVNRMLILGLLLVVVSAAGTALVISYNSSGGPEQTIVMFGRDWLSVTPLQAFIAGLVVALVFCVGVWMIVSTERRRRAVRSEYREVRREARTAARERDRLARELAARDERDEVPATTVTERPTAWTAPEEAAVARHGETTETQEPEPRRGFGRHFGRSGRTAETEAPASSTPPQ